MIPQAAPDAQHDFPVALVLDVHQHFVFVACPFCRRTHAHSSRLGRSAVKPSHCSGHRPYRLVQAGAA